MKRIALTIFTLLVIYNSQVSAQKTTTSTFNPADRPKNLSDSALLDLVQKQTFRYFWDFAHPVSNLSRERSNEAYNYGNEVVTTGGTGFGIMSVIVAAERKWITRDTAAKFLLKMVNFLLKADSYHGVFPHWLNGATGKTIPFSRKDDGADLVETSYLFQGLLCASNILMEITEQKENYAIELAGCGMILNGIGLQKVEKYCIGIGVQIMDGQ